MAMPATCPADVAAKLAFIADLDEVDLGRLINRDPRSR
jgi:hypothetical protein